MFQPAHIDASSAPAPGRPGHRAPGMQFRGLPQSDYVGSTEHIVKTIKEAPAGTRWLVGTELNLVDRLAEEVLPKARSSSSWRPPSACARPCSASTRSTWPGRWKTWPTARSSTRSGCPSTKPSGQTRARADAGDFLSGHEQAPALHVTTFNIHKGFSQFNRRMMVHELRERLRHLNPGHRLPAGSPGLHLGHAENHDNWPSEPQHEFLAEDVWQSSAYGRNMVYDHGHHGNAILSRFPILHSAQPGRHPSAVRETRPAALPDRIARRPGRPLRLRAPLAVRLFAPPADGGAGRVPRPSPTRRTADHRRRLQRLEQPGRRSSRTAPGTDRSFQRPERHVRPQLPRRPANVPPRSHLRARLQGPAHRSPPSGNRGPRFPTTLRCRPTWRGMAAEFLPGNRITLLNSGSEYFPALLAEIEAAQLEIYLESYIFADDAIGHEVTAPCALRPHAASRSGFWSTASGRAISRRISCRALWPPASSPCPTGRK
jgi:hypothetical protein